MSEQGCRWGRESQLKLKLHASKDNGSGRRIGLGESEADHAARSTTKAGWCWLEDRLENTSSRALNAIPSDAMNFRKPSQQVRIVRLYFRRMS